MVICKARETCPRESGGPCPYEAYTVRRSDEGRVQRRRWPFIDSLPVQLRGGGGGRAPDAQQGDRIS